MAERSHRTPLDGCTLPAGGMDRVVTLSEITGRGMIDLRLKSPGGKASALVKEMTGATLPQKPRTSRTAGDTTILWLSLDQWLITLPLDQRDACFEGLRTGLEHSHALVTDQSDARAIIRLEGAHAREVIMKGASADLTAPEFVRGTVRRMLFAELAAMCHFVSDPPETLDLYVFRSYANYVWDWLVQTSHPNAEVALWRNQPVPPV